jgi:hypothetical protein
VVSCSNETDCDIADNHGQDGFYRAGCPSEGRFTDNGDGTVTDNCTGLMWQKDTPSGTYKWWAAIDYCEGLSLGSHSDWRLSNVRELQSSVDYGRFSPAIDPVFEAVSDEYWSSLSFAFEGDGLAGYMHFRDGHVNCGNAGAANHHVRAVRGGL